MAIRIHLSKLLGQRKMKMADLSRKTGISKNTLSTLYSEKVTMIKFETLEKICEALNCTVGELLEYQPDTDTSNT
jgi:putative transcriptional regulator